MSVASPRVERLWSRSAIYMEVESPILPENIHVPGLHLHRRPTHVDQKNHVVMRLLEVEVVLWILRKNVVARNVN